MSDTFVYTDMNGFVTEHHSGHKTADSKVMMLKVLVGVLCAVLAVEVVLYTVIIPSLVPVKISFSGLQQYTSEELVRILNVSSDDTWIRFDTAAAASALATCAAIESVSVEKRFPDTVFVSVTERIPVATTLIEADGRTLPVQIDKNGVLFSAKAGTSVAQLPLVTGLPVEQYADGMRLHSKYRALMQQLAALETLPQKYLTAVSEIHIEPKEYGNYELVLYPTYSKTRVLTDRTLNEDALQYMIVVLDVVNSIEPDIAEIDLRYGSVSFRTAASAF
ncbi:cell division protein FtsQ/DivIB [Treponema brennaborense]|uniref:Polypeptide-transport-associated domain protein FtsQ-type n=1 Tax=Treponema brennaborense (strain DSM 12168 / CIP 105900 / DD5/3) TaxID=906968 RepID=F4LJJ2_TREBD|nr:FtsQ-type POTRA domain-containing protein [Treponema brennaborense]AEE16387.1 Polypeptide-transport-associated domain protein FtsQ-type [Treponema brennaborense DSM 12168]